MNNSKWCNRCKESIPLEEWKYWPEAHFGQVAGEHVGCGDGIDSDTGRYPPCGYRERVPIKIGK